MSHRVSLLVLALLALASFATAQAQEDVPVVLKLEGHEGPLVCDPTALEVLCFTTTEGDPATAFASGATVRVELTAMPLEGAPGGAPHNLAVALDGTLGDLQGINSEAGGAIAASDVAESGATVTLEFTVPETGTLYFWCDVGDHEFLGMNFKSEIQPAADDGATNETNGTGDDGSDDNATAPGDNNTTADDDDTAGDVGDAPVPDDGTDNETADEDGASDVTEESPAIPMLAVPLLAGAYLAARRRQT